MMIPKTTWMIVLYLIVIIISCSKSLVINIKDNISIRLYNMDDYS